MERVRSLVRAAALVLAALSGLPTQAACSKPYTVGVSSLGWGYFKQDGKVQGVLPDLTELLARRSGCELRLVELPRPRAIADFMAGAVDIVTSAIRTPERDEVGSYVAYGYTDFDLAVLESVPLWVNSLAALVALPDLRVGTVRGLQLSPELTAAVTRLGNEGRIELASDFDNLAVRLNARRFQAAIFPTMLHSKLAREGKLAPGVRFLSLAELEPIPLGMYFHLKQITAADRPQLESALRQLVQDRVIEALYRRYLTEAEMRHLFRGR